MPSMRTRRQGPARNTEQKERNWVVCADAAAEMETIVGGLEEYPDLYEETAALRRQLSRIETACRASQAGSGEDWDGLARDDPKQAAQSLIERLPLREVFQDPALSNAFLSELLLALARESSAEERKERQKQGIAQAKAEGVRFGAPTRPLPDGFDELRRAWRGGKLTLREAAEMCGMAQTTFYNAARREERAAKQAEAAPY